MPSIVFAATITGTIYDENLIPATDVLVTINTVPEQRMLSKDGMYSFALPLGNYTLQARYMRAETTFLTTEQVFIEQAGVFQFDLFLLPSFDQELPTNVITNTSIIEQQERAPNVVRGTLTRFFIVTTILLLVYFVYRVVVLRTRKVISEATPLEEQLVTLLKNNDGRMTQKNIRKNFSHSEATMSLLLTELEEKKIIEKIKKGRTNIIILKE